MWRIRAFEERVGQLTRADEVHGLVHLSTGQEAVAVGVCSQLRDDDVVYSGHRAHGHALAKGAPMRAVMAELMGRDTGLCRGLGGSMHLVDRGHGFLGATGVVGGNVPLALGSALAARLSGSDAVAVVFFGDGAVQGGIFVESVNIAALWKLPAILVCENNGFAEFTPRSTHTVVERVTDVVAPYGFPRETVDGNDLHAVHEAFGRFLTRARAGEGPFLLECLTHRLGGHYEGDPQRYRDQIGDEEWRAIDPILRLGGGEGLEEEARAEVEDAVEFARSSPFPPPELTAELVLGTVPAGDCPCRDVGVTTRQGQPGSDPRETTYLGAITSTLAEAMRADGHVLVLGEDVAEGGPWGATVGLADEFGPERVRNTPISEAAIAGIAIGAAQSGLRPVVEIMFVDFVTLALDQLVNQAAKAHFMSGGQLTVPLVLRTQGGAGQRGGAQHSQSLEAWLAHVPGLRVVMPSTPADAAGLLRAAIADPNPVVYVENKTLYFRREPFEPEEILIGRARVVRHGRDVTVVALSRLVHESLAAAKELAAQGIEVEVIDPRTLVPLDLDTIVESVSRTHRLVVAHEAVEHGGFGAEIVAQVQAAAFDELDAPIARVGAPFAPIPFSPQLEDAYLPGRDEVIAAVRQAV
jgi:2-oxoisovalerate dehydrogenase E1 component